MENTKTKRTKKREAITAMRNPRHLCSGCAAELTQADRELGTCTQCSEPVRPVDVFFQHVEVLGFPGVVVTRLFYCQWLASRGFDLRPTGRLDSWDYMVWGTPATTRDLTDEKTRDRALAWMAKQRWAKPVEREAA